GLLLRARKSRLEVEGVTSNLHLRGTRTGIPWARAEADASGWRASGRADPRSPSPRCSRVLVDAGASSAWAGRANPGVRPQARDEPDPCAQCRRPAPRTRTPRLRLAGRLHCGHPFAQFAVRTVRATL